MTGKMSAYCIATPTRRHYLTSKPSWITLGRSRPAGNRQIRIFDSHAEAEVFAFTLATEEDLVCGHRYVLVPLKAPPGIVEEAIAKLDIDAGTLSLGQKAALAAQITAAWFVQLK